MAHPMPPAGAADPLESALLARLRPGEQLLWCGRPRPSRLAVTGWLRRRTLYGITHSRVLRLRRAWRTALRARAHAALPWVRLRAGAAGSGTISFPRRPPRELRRPGARMGPRFVSLVALEGVDEVFGLLCRLRSAAGVWTPPGAAPGPGSIRRRQR